MHPLSHQDPDCSRARAWASLELDDELSEVEKLHLASHLGACRSCAAAVEELRAFTAALRAAPLELPERALALPARPPVSRRGATRVRFALAAAALVALAASLGALGLSGGSEPSRPAPANPPEIALLPTSDEFRQLRASRARALNTPKERRVLPTRLAGRI